MPSPKTPPVWRRAFLRALRETASATLAAERAGVCKTTTYALRRRDRRFASDWARAVQAGRDQLADASRPPPLLAGAQIVRRSTKGRPCVMRAGPGRWSTAAEGVFLSHLMTTANVKAAARAAGVSAVAVYARRREDAGFEANWDDALRLGYSRVEMDLIANATATLGGDELPADVPVPRMTVNEAMNLLKLHRASVHGGKAQRYGWRKVEPSFEEVRAEIEAKLAALRRGEEAEREREAGDGA